MTVQGPYRSPGGVGFNTPPRAESLLADSLALRGMGGTAGLDDDDFAARASSWRAPRAHRSGAVGSEMSAGGFGLLGRISQAISSTSRRALTAGALGFLLLLPPIVGQVMIPGGGSSTVGSPVAAMMAQQAEVQTGAQIRRAVVGSVAKVPADVGAAREAALVGVIDVVQRADKQARLSGKIASEASRRMGALKAEVGADARLGYVVDLYWFGVPDDHMMFHRGTDDSGTIAARDADVRGAASYARSTARDEVSKLLVQESPSFKATKTRFDVVDGQYKAGQALVRSAAEARAALESASTAITLRNAIPKTISVDDYAARTTRDAKGNSTTVRVKTGSHQAANPAWAMANVAAVVAKTKAESKVRAMNATVTQVRAHVPDAQLRGVDANLTGVLDIFGHPSFLIWSFDSNDVSRAKEKVAALGTSGSKLVSSLAPEHGRLEGSIRRSIDMRWDNLLESRSAPQV